MLMLSVRHALATLTSVLNTGEQEDIGRTLDDAQKALDDDPDRLEPRPVPKLDRLKYRIKSAA